MSVNIIPLIIRLEPDNYTFNLWGGRWIPRFKKLPSPARVVGESWEFSGHKNHPSQVRLFDGTVSNLRKLVHAHAKEILGSKVIRSRGREVPFLLKFIDARENLSLQVHPDDAYAGRHEKDSGKAEAWFILETGNKKGEGFIYLGFNPLRDEGKRNQPRLKNDFKETLALVNRWGPCRNSKIRDKAARLILPFLNKVRVRPGEIYDLRPGTLHAIGKGVRLFEVQQTSDLTYRVWDWNRAAKRPLHVAKAFDVLEFTAKDPRRFRIIPRRIRHKKERFHQQERLCINRKAGYAVDRIFLKRKGATTNQRNQNFFSVLTVIEGAAKIHAADVSDGRTESLRVSAGHTVLIPAVVKNFSITSETNQSTLLKSFPPL